MKKLILPFLLIVLAHAYGQGNFPVNLHTGTPSIALPLASISAQDIGDHVALTYNPKGVSVKTPNGYYGIGWDLRAGGRISREVRGIPDDRNNAARTGWLYNQANVSVGALPNTADLSSATCSDEQADFNAIAGWNYQRDTEPDIFHYSFGGYSGSFVFDNSATPTVRLMPWADIRIVPQFHPTSGKITDFVVTTNDGTVYEFNVPYDETYSVSKPSVAPATIEFLKTEYEQYAPGALAFTTGWMLGKTTSPSGAYLRYTYTTESYLYKEDYQPDHTVMVKQKINGGADYTIRYLFDRHSSNDVKRLVAIESSSSQKIEFTYTGNINDPNKMLTLVTLIDNRRPEEKKVIRELSLEYDIVGCTIGCSQAGMEDGYNFIDYSHYKRRFLRAIKQKTFCDNAELYRFTYKDRELLPLPNSLKMDFWGYFNGKSIAHRLPTIYIYPALPPHERYRVFPIDNYSGEQYVIPGGDLSVNPNTVHAGVLRDIVYGSGARTTFEFEPHEFYDAVANQSYYGGGLRIRSITSQDGVNPDATIKRSFVYQDDTGKSSGRMLYKPSFVVPLHRYVDPDNAANVLTYSDLVAQGKNPWLYLAATVDVDMAEAYTRGDVVRYEQVTEKQVGAGSVKHRYLLPGMWNNSAAGEWTPSDNKFARSSACPALDLVTSGGGWRFPYAPNPDYSYAQGLPAARYEYNEQDVLVRETHITYNDLFLNNNASQKVWGVRYHKMPYTDDVMFFSKYFLLTDGTKVAGQQNTIVYDVANSAKNITESIQYFHESNAHRLLSRVRKVESDGSVYTTHYRYPLDYGTVPSGADKPSEMIGKLQTTFRNGTPVEVYTSLQRPGDTETFISGSIVKFNDFGTTLVLPQYQLALRGVPLSTFTPSAIHATTKVLETDSHYETVSTVTAFTSYGKALTAIGESRVPVSTSWGHNFTLPVAEVTNASSNEFAFSDFEPHTSSNQFTEESGQTQPGDHAKKFGTGHTGKYGIPADIPLKRTLIKGADTYVVSGWLKNGSTGGVTLTVTIKNTSGTTMHTQSHVIPQSAIYKYFRYEVPIPGSVTQFEVTIQGSYGTATPEPHLDDVAFYPKHAELVSYAYHIPYGVSATTHADQTVSQRFNSRGQVRDTFDRDGNLVAHNEYFDPSVSTTTVVLNAQFTAPVNTYYGVATQFSAPEHCPEDILYEWDFGSGFEPGSRVQSHTFTSVGSKTITLRLSHPDHGTATYSKTITVQSDPE